jgi:hypothetical protein
MTGLVKGLTGSRRHFCADLDLEPVAILGRFVFRWRIETTFQEVREHLGVGTQRQWSDLAMLRTTPALLGLYTLWALGLMNAPNTAVRTHTAAWHQKTQPTFSDAIDAVGCLLWTPKDVSMSRQQTESVVTPIQLLKRFVEMSRRMDCGKSS